MNRLIINFGFAVGLVLLINCGQEESSGGDSIYWGTYVVFEDDVEGLFQSNDSYDVTKFNASTPREHNVFNSTFEHELANGRNRFLWSLSGLTPHYLDYGNGDIDTLTHISKEFDPKADYPSDIRYYLNGEEVAHFDLRIGGIINELSARNNFSSSRWTNDPILIVLPKKPEMWVYSKWIKMTSGVDGQQMLSIYPNPAVHQLTLSPKYHTEIDLTIYKESTGEKVLFTRLIKQKTIDVSGLGKGNYIVEDISKKDKIVKQLIIKE